MHRQEALWLTVFQNGSCTGHGLRPPDGEATIRYCKQFTVTTDGRTDHAKLRFSLMNRDLH